MSKAYREGPQTGGETRAQGTGSPGKRTMTSNLVAQAGGSSGAPLPGQAREQFESSLCADLSGVRVHTGADSAASAEAVGARAFTMGNDIHFGSGQYQPDDPFGLHLLAHEVAHTQQQAGSEVRQQNKLEVSSPDDPAEHEADRVADAMVAGKPATVSPGGAAVARKIFRKTKADAIKEAQALGDAEQLATSIGGGGGGTAEPSPWGQPIAEPKGSYYGGSAIDDYVGTGAPLAGAPQTADTQYTEPPTEGTGFSLPEGQVAVPVKSGGGGGGGKAPTGKPAPAPTDGTSPAPAVDDDPVDFSSIGPVQNPSAGIEPESSTKLKKFPVGAKTRFSHTFKTKFVPPKDLRYALVDAGWVKIDVEVTVPGSIATVTPVHSKGETGGGKTTVTSQKEISISPDQLKLNFDGDGQIAPKAGWEESSDKKVLSVGLDMKWGAAAGEVKLELWGTDKGELITPKIAPGFGGNIDQKINVEGYEVAVKGKMLVGCDIKPSPRLLELLGRGASTAGGAGAGAGAGAAALETIPTGFAAVPAGTILFAAGLMMIPATMFAGLKRGADESNEMKKLGKKAEDAAGDFINGYCSAFGVGSGSGSDFGKAGADLGEKKLDIHVKRMEQAYELIKQKNPEIGDLTDADRATMREHAKQKVQASAASFKEQAKKAFYWWIQAEIFRAWKKHAEAEDRWFFDKHQSTVRTYLLGTNHAPLEPDWRAFENGPLPP
jgi:hypothetical protein